MQFDSWDDSGSAFRCSNSEEPSDVFDTLSFRSFFMNF